MRFINIKVHKTIVKGWLSATELRAAANRIVKLVQLESFPNELRILNSKQQVEGKLGPLAPFVDSEGIMRVGRRVSNSDLPYNAKHPALLPSKHNITA